MSDKVRWPGSGTMGIAPRPALIDRYVAARADVNGDTHIGRVTPNGVIVQVCETAPNPVLLPAPEGAAVECPECLYIMRHDNVFVNTAVRFEQLR